MQVLLLSMPWAPFNRPSIQLGALKGYLDRQFPDLCVQSRHPSLTVAAAIGPDRYRRISENTWAGEALYSGLLFPELREAARRLFQRELPDLGAATYDALLPVLDAHLDTCLDPLPVADCQLVGFSVCFSQLSASLLAASRLKARRPEVRVVFGGSVITPELARSIREDEERCDHYEDIIGTYLVQLSSHSLSDGESQESTELLKTIGDFERISDHAVNVLESAEELQSKKLSFSPAAMAEYQTLARATRRILHLSLDSFRQDDPVQAAQVEPLEQVIDALKEELRTRHILRMRRGQCSIEAGFVWVDLLTDLERTSDHCSNVAGCVIDAGRHNLNLHETLRAAQTQDPDYAGRFRAYAQEYCLPEGE